MGKGPANFQRPKFPLHCNFHNISGRPDLTLRGAADQNFVIYVLFRWPLDSGLGTKFCVITCLFEPPLDSRRFAIGAESWSQKTDFHHPNAFQHGLSGPALRSPGPIGPWSEGPTDGSRHAFGSKAGDTDLAHLGPRGTRPGGVVARGPGWIWHVCCIGMHSCVLVLRQPVCNKRWFVIICRGSNGAWFGRPMFGE